MPCQCQRPAFAETGPPCLSPRTIVVLDLFLDHAPPMLRRAGRSNEPGTRVDHSRSKRDLWPVWLLDVER
jgi:hypothetical protein